MFSKFPGHTDLLRGSGHTDLLSGPVPATLLSFSWPFMLSTLLQTLYTTADTVIVGQYLGSAGLCAVSNAGLLMQLLYMLCVGFASGGQVMIAQCAGAGRHDQAQKVIGTLFVIQLVLSVLTGGICILFARPFLQLLHTPDEALSQAAGYVAICGGGMLFTSFYNAFSVILRGYGDSRHPLVFVAIASVINVLLDLLFIAVFHWNVAGAALATIIGQLCSVLFSMHFCLKHKNNLQFSVSPADLRADSQTARSMIRIGIPMALHNGTVQFSFLFVGRMINTLGLDFSAAFGVSQKLRNLPNILIQGLALGATSMIGQNWGAKKADRVSSTVRWGIFYSAIINAAACLLLSLMPVLSFRLFTQDEAVFSYAKLCVAAIIFERPGQTLMPPCMALVNAQGYVRFSLIVGLVDAFVGRVFFCWFLGSFCRLGGFGFLLGYACGTYLSAIPGFIYYISGKWKSKGRRFW